MEGDNNAEPKAFILFEGYSIIEEEGILTDNCTTTLIKGPVNVIIDTRTAWDGEEMIEALKEKNITPDEINYVVCTHGHSDHIGCNYLFKNATHIVGFCVSNHNKYFLKPNFFNGEEFVIDNHIKVIPTPGHTLQDVTVLFSTKKVEGNEGENKIIAITGDLFEKEADLLNEKIWIEIGVDNVELQRKNRKKILEIADYIVPGHGPMFKVPKVEFNEDNQIIKVDYEE